MSLNNRNIDSELKKSEDKKKDKVKEETDLRFRNVATIGSDEVGTGDYFGPIVVTASYVSKENIKEVMNLGVKDSKKITDDIIVIIISAIITIELIISTFFFCSSNVLNFSETFFRNLNLSFFSSIFNPSLFLLHINIIYLTLKKCQLKSNYFKYNTTLNPTSKFDPSDVSALEEIGYLSPSFQWPPPLPT